jgi:carbon-monoxide dehydrogenase iron sulfur subunit
LKRILVRPERCLGCEACELACILVHSRTEGAAEALRKGASGVVGVRVHSGIQRRSSTVRGKPGSGRSLQAYPIRCHQCADPKCVSACAAGALEKGEDGVVRVIEGQCIGCGICVMVCHYGAIQIDKGRKLAVKCDLCPGQEFPACVLACKTDALWLVEEEEGAER